MNPHSNCATRRSLLAGAAAIGAATLLPRSAHAANAAPPKTLIDVHFHVGSPKLAALQAARGGGRGNNPSAETLLGVLDEGGVATGVCSTIIPTDVTDDIAAIRDASRDANEHMAKLRADNPGRFAMLASLPLPDIDATLKEIAYAFDTLHADGVHMPTSVGGYWFGDPTLAPVMAELNRRKAVVKTHPAVGPCCRIPAFVPYGATGVVELGTDTMRAISVVLFSGAANKYRDMHIIWSHAGGALLGQLQRYVNAADTGKFKEQLPNGPEAELKRFHYDLAQAVHPVTMKELKNFVPNSQILFGTDYPFWTPKKTIDTIRAGKIFSEAEIAGWAGNARTLFNLKG